jgi:primary-amine oxidase
MSAVDLPRLLHPLEPLSAQEVIEAVRILREERRPGERERFISVSLHEPPKNEVLAYHPDSIVGREVMIILLDHAEEATYEAIVSLSEDRVKEWSRVPGVQPSISFEEILEVERLVKADATFRSALHRRGIHDLDLVMVEPWPAGNYGEAVEGTRRLSRPIIFVRSYPGDNGHAHPVEGLFALVDLNAMQVLRVEDQGDIPIPPEPGNYGPDSVGPLRSDLKPVEIAQPDGPSFQVDGHEVRWQKWRIRLGFTPREGLVLYTVGYEDQGRVRPILYRASLAEMIVPYGDPGQAHYRKNVLDMGEHGLGVMANSLELGCDCLGHIHYFDAVVTNGLGEAVVLKNAICMHEEDYGVLWKHTDWRTGEAQVRRSRRLVVSFFATVGHYDYGFYWYFYQDGSMQYEVKLTGVMNCRAIPPGERPKYGTLVAPGLVALNHQHFFNVRLDMMVDGVTNSVYEVHTEAVPLGPDNPYGNAFSAASRLLATEAEGQQIIDPLSARYWKVVNPAVSNRFGDPVGYKLVPGENVLPFAHESFPALRRAAFTRKHLWVTPYDPGERFPAGDYPNQHPGGAGLPAWSALNRSIENTNVVLWYTFGAHHVPRPEDWPVMPVQYIGFTLKPVGFFERNPALDVPPPPGHHNSQEPHS